MLITVIIVGWHLDKIHILKAKKGGGKKEGISLNFIQVLHGLISDLFYLYWFFKEVSVIKNGFFLTFQFTENSFKIDSFPSPKILKFNTR